MSRLFALIILTAFSVSNSWATVSPPSNYSQYAQDGAVTTYKHISEDIYAIVVDTSDANISFGGDLGYAGSNTYFKGSITEHWNYNANSGTVAVVNGQFFDILGSSYKYFTADPARLVYPVKSNWSSLSSGVYDNNFTLRSLLINSSGKVYMREGFSQALFNSSSIKEYLVGLYPSAVKAPSSNIGRNYIGGIPANGCNPSTSSCEYEYLIFFVAKSTTHYNMLHQLSIWSVPAKSRIMMDGSGSAKMYLQKSNGTKVLNGDYRRIPHSIVIGNK